jgi:CheY-like chemotaxis protein
MDLASLEKKTHILVAEDEPGVAKLLQLFLKSCDFAVTIAANGEEAVKKWKEGEYDLILMDIRMPVLDGCGAAQMIRSQERKLGRRHIPIVALTAAAHVISERMREICMFNDILSKPFKGQKLREILSQHTAN